MSLLKLFLKNIFFLILFLFLGDLIVSYFSDIRSYNRTSARVINPFFHHGFIPNRKFSHEWVEGIVIEEIINKFGFRENITDTNIRNLSDYNTVILGDSFLEGVGVENKNIVASLIKSSYHPVANLAVSSHSPSISKERLNYFKKKGLKPKNIIHFVDISDIQDEYIYEVIKGFKPINLGIGNYILEFINNTPISKSFTYKSLIKSVWVLNTPKPFYNLIKIITSLDIYINYPGGRNLLFSERNPFTSQKEPFYYEAGKKKLLSVINDLASNNDGSYTIVIYPYPSTVNIKKGDPGFIRLKSFKNELKKIVEKFGYLNLCDLNGVDFIETDFIKNDIHWNENGNIKVSKYINNYCL